VAGFRLLRETPRAIDQHEAPVALHQASTGLRLGLIITKARIVCQAEPLSVLEPEHRHEQGREQALDLSAASLDPDRHAHRRWVVILILHRCVLDLLLAGPHHDAPPRLSTVMLHFVLPLTAFTLIVVEHANGARGTFNETRGGDCRPCRLVSGRCEGQRAEALR